MSAEDLDSMVQEITVRCGVLSVERILQCHIHKGRDDPDGIIAFGGTAAAEFLTGCVVGLEVSVEFGPYLLPKVPEELMHNRVI